MKNRPVAELLIAVGGLTACAVQPGDVFRLSCASQRRRSSSSTTTRAANSSPSAEDVAITERLRQAGALLGVRVLDHVIPRERHFSFRDAGLLPG